VRRRKSGSFTLRIGLTGKPLAALSGKPFIRFQAFLQQRKTCKKIVPLPYRSVDSVC